jgi:outer membrane protein assembly complex protein YaeT
VLLAASATGLSANPDHPGERVEAGSAPAWRAAPLPLAGWQDLVRKQISRSLERMWGAPVRFESVEFGVAPPQLILHGVECATSIGGWRAAVRVARLVASPVLWSLVRGKVEWEMVEVEGLSLDLVDAAASPAQPALLPAAADQPEPLIMGSLRVSRGTLTLRAGDLLVRSGFSLQGTGKTAKDAVVGRINVESLEAQWESALGAPLRLAGSADWSWSSEGLRLDPLRLHGEAAEITLQARLGASLSRIEGDVTLHPSAMHWKPPAGVDLGGGWKLAGWLKAESGAWQAEGTLQGEDLSLRDWPLGRISARWKATQGSVEVSEIGVPLEGGAATVSARVRAPYETLELSIESSSIPAALTSRLWPDAPAIQGRLLTKLQVEVPLAGPLEQARGRGSIRLSPAPGAPWPLRIEAKVEGGVEAFQAEGSWRMGDLLGDLEATQARARFTLSPTTVARLLPWGERALGRPLAGFLGDVNGTVSGESEVSIKGRTLSWRARFPVAALSLGGHPLGEAEVRAGGDGARWKGDARLQGGDAPGALEGVGVLRWAMEAWRPETWTGRVLADLRAPIAGGATLRLQGDLSATGTSRLSVTTELPDLRTTLDMQLQREADSTWTAQVRAGDGAEGWADVRLRSGARGGLEGVSGQVGSWRLQLPSADEVLAGLFAEYLEMSAKWSLATGGPVASLRLLDQTPDGGSRPWGSGELTWEEGRVVVRLSRDSPPLRIDVSAAPRGAWPFRVEALAPPSEVEVGPAARLTTLLSGGMRVEGTLRPWAWSADLNLERFALVSGDQVWLASGPVRGSGSPASWRLEPIHLQGQAGRLDVEMDPASGGLRATGDLSVAPLTLWLGEARFAGSVHADLRWAPGQAASGTLTVEGLQFFSSVLPFPMEDLQGEIRLEPGHVELRQLHGRAGAGTLSLSGRVPLPHSAQDWDLALEARGVSIRQPPGLSGVADLSLRMQGPPSTPRLVGDLSLHQGVYTIPFSLVRGGNLPVDLDFSDVVPPAAQALGLDIALNAEHLWIRSDYTKLECRGKLQLSGTLARPIVGGRLAAVEGGEVRFNEVRYSVTSGLLEFTAARSASPNVELQADTERGDYKVHLEVRGTVDDLKISLRSEPPLPTPEIVRLLTTGRVGTPGTEAPAGSLAEGLLGSVVSGSVLAPLESGLQSVLPVDRLYIDPLAVSGQGDPTTRITLGKRLSRRVSLEYSSNLGSNQEDLYQLRYRMQPDVDMTLSREDDGSLGADLLFSRRLYPPGSRPPDSEIEPHPLIRRIRFRGETPFRTRRLRSVVTVAPGERASAYELFDSRERLWGLHARAGYPQARVEASLRPRRHGSADAVFDINAGARLEVRLEGAEMPRGLHAAILELWDDPGLRSLIPARAEALVSGYFQDQGYPACSARLAGVTQEDGREVWTFQVEMGHRVKVESLRFRGSTPLAHKDLLGAIQTRADLPGERGYFVTSRLRADTRALENLHVSAGYADAQVQMDPPQFSADGRRAQVGWRIEAGAPYRVDQVGISPEETAILLAGFLDRLNLRAGGVFSSRALSVDSEALRARLDLLGYPRARVESRVEGPPQALRVGFQVQPGPRQIVGEVKVEGNRRTRERVIRRELAFRSGDPLSQQKLDDSQRNLYQMGVFRSVSVEAVGAGATPQTAAVAQGEPPAPVPIQVRILESAPLSVGAGFGYDSVDHFRGRLDLADRNLFGTRRYAGLVLRGGSIERRAQALVRDPRLFNTRLAGLASAFYEMNERDTFTERRRGARLQVERKQTRRLTQFYGYVLEDVDLADVSVTAEEIPEQQRLADLSWTLAYDSRNDFADPRHGLFGSVDLKWFAGPIGSDAEFGRAFLEISYYRPLSQRVVWASALRTGLARPYGADESVPISERFFSGGDSSVRGFERNHLGPLDPVTGEPLGGELSLIYNQEVRFPIWRSLRGVAFYDGGNVFSTSDDLSMRDLRSVLGVGLRLNTPIGPLRLDYGRVLDRKEGEDPGALYFSIGQAF